VPRRTVGGEKVDFHQRNVRTFATFWWKILNNVVRIHSAVYRWAIEVNMVGENYDFVTGAHTEFFLGGGGGWTLRLRIIYV
jgi:hypothetical protein